MPACRRLHALARQRAKRCRPSARCATRPSARAVTSWSARCACSPAATPAADVLEALSQALTNKLLHAPTHALHQAQEPDREQLVKLLERVYLIRGRE